MEKHLYDTPSDPVPTYEESVEQGTRSDTKPNLYHTSDTPSLTDQLTTVRTNRVQSLLTAYIKPLLQTTALAGILHTNLILVPSNNSSFDPSGESEVIGFPSSAHLQLIYLCGPSYTVEFWRQPTVIKDLDSALKAHLQASGHRFAEDDSISFGFIPHSPPLAASPTASNKKRLLSWWKAPEELKSTVPAQEGSSYGTVKEQALAPGRVRTKVGLQDVCFRVMTEMGLYETRVRKALLVEVEVGC